MVVCRRTMQEEIKIDRESLEDLADYVADDLREHGGPEMDYLRESVKDAYDALDK